MLQHQALLETERALPLPRFGPGLAAVLAA